MSYQSAPKILGDVKTMNYIYDIQNSKEKEKEKSQEYIYTSAIYLSITKTGSTDFPIHPVKRGERGLEKRGKGKGRKKKVKGGKKLKGVKREKETREKGNGKMEEGSRRRKSDHSLR